MTGQPATTVFSHTVGDTRTGTPNPGAAAR